MGRHLLDTTPPPAHSSKRPERTARGRLAGVCFCALILATGAAAMTANAATIGFETDTRLLDTLPPTAYAPHFPEGQNASEDWNYLFTFTNGYRFLCQFRVTNIGPGSGRGGVVSMLFKPEAETKVIKNSRGRDDWQWTVNEHGVEMRIARHRLEIAHPRHTMRISDGQHVLTLEAETLTPIYRPGRLRFGDSKFYDLTVLAPRMQANGELRLPDGSRVPLENGAGIALHSYSNLSEHKQAVRQLRFDSFDREVQISLFSFMATRQYRYQEAGFLFLTRGNRIVFESTHYRLVDRMTRPDETHPHYPVPVQLTFRHGASGERVRGRLELEPVFRYETLSLLNSAFLRKLLSLITQPVRYECAADYEVTYDIGNGREEMEGRGVASVYIFDDPPEEE